VLAGRYRLEDRVRTRPGGALWRAVDETLDRSVLVQAFEPGHPHGPEIVDAARRAALVEDHRLQRVLAAGEERGTAYVVLERLSGRTLVELLGAGPLPAETARRVVGEAAQALDRAAARGLHHLRLGPTNLVVAPDGNVTLVGTAIDAAADGAEPANTGIATRTDAVDLVSHGRRAWPGGPSRPGTSSRACPTISTPCARWRSVRTRTGRGHRESSQHSSRRGRRPPP
jgi:eukaryotic-like serine/threonine-protein kinase